MVSQGQKVGQTIIGCIGSNFHLYRKTGCDSGGESNGTVLSASTNRVISSVGACYWRDEANVQCFSDNLYKTRKVESLH